VKCLGRFLHRKHIEAQPGPQGEEYEALKVARHAAEEREAFSENVIKKFGHKNLPFLDDPYK